MPICSHSHSKNSPMNLIISEQNSETVYFVLKHQLEHQEFNSCLAGYHNIGKGLIYLIKHLLSKRK
jgi:hypothetical protein